METHSSSLVSSLCELLMCCLSLSAQAVIVRCHDCHHYHRHFKHPMVPLSCRVLCQTQNYHVKLGNIDRYLSIMTRGIVIMLLSVYCKECPNVTALEKGKLKMYVVILS